MSSHADKGPDIIKEKAGVVAYREHSDSEPELLIVSSRKFPGGWVFPVGSVEEGEMLEAAAIRECREESGYQVAVVKQFEPIVDSQSGKTTRFTYFLGNVEAVSENRETDRQRTWVPISRIAEYLPELFRPLVAQARAVLQSGDEASA